MTTALYRRYRPDTFQDVIGQDHVTFPLMAALRGDRVTHAYLFSGPRGCGKTTSARILARCLNCEQAPTDTPCGSCPSCRDLATGGPGSLDVVEIDAASHNGVDDARDLRERAAFAPARDRYKIFILDEAHMVTPQGFNALLKLVEEPPAHVKFIFATTEPEKVIGTIRSRTHHYPFRLVPPDLLEGYLSQLCQAERVEVGPGVFPLVTRAGGGSVRDTLSVMDQLIGGAVDGSVDYQRAVALLGYTDTTLLDQCVDAIAAADGAGVFRVVDRVVSSGHDPRRFVEDLLQRLRDLLVISLAGEEARPALGSMPADELDRMEVQARTLGGVALSRAADATSRALGQMVGATSPRLQLELLMARLLVPTMAGGAGGAAVGGPAPAAGEAATGGAQPSATVSGVGLPGGLPGGTSVSASSGSAKKSQREQPGWGGPARSAQASVIAPAEPNPFLREAPQAAPTEGSSSSRSAADAAGPAPEAVSNTRFQGRQSAPVGRSNAGAPGVPGAAGGAAEAEMIRQRWGEVLEVIKRERRMSWALVSPYGQPGTLEGGVFSLLFPSQGLISTFEGGGHGPVVVRALHQALGVQAQVRAVLSGGDGGGSGGTGGNQGGPNQPNADAGRSQALNPFVRQRPSERAGSPVAAGTQGASDTGGSNRTTVRARGRDAAVLSQHPAGERAAEATQGVASPVAPAAEAAPAAGHQAQKVGHQAQKQTPTPVGDPGFNPFYEYESEWASPPPPDDWYPAEPAPVVADASRSNHPAPASRSNSPSSTTATSPATAEQQLASVHRIRALPDLPPAKSSGGSGGNVRAHIAVVHREDAPEEAPRFAPLAPVSWMDPVDLPGAAAPVAADPNGPASNPTLNPTTSPAVGAAKQAPGNQAAPGSRAAAARNAVSRVRSLASSRPAVSLADDIPSDDDEDAEEAGVVGIEVVKQVLGATVIEEVVVTQEGS
ncbi:DNA polymerase III subunit gamma and tau [Actinomyces trachealis]|uniref:DNA polymerase III subunit gamma and tau n=1 Tax=Actinomyces trachealis TaxID=2763540 RepID=UPI0018C561D8|nr:DNA polymerase III subunit gamma and tau [Actinomyces trachealis]